MGMSLTKTGDWKRAGVVLKGINTKLSPTIKGQLLSDGQFILQKLQSHIDSQDLGWVPLSEKTIELKNGDDTIYIETGYLRGNLSVRKVKSSSKDTVYFIGASAWKKHPSGVKFSDLMIWLEYGTNKQPPRPLIRPTFDEVNDLLKSNWLKTVLNFIRNGG